MCRVCLLSWTFVSLVVLVCGHGAGITEVTQSTLPTVLHDNKCVFIYAIQEDCDRCKLLYHTFLVAAQNFRNDKSIFFGIVSEETLIQAFDVSSFPGIVYYEFGSVVPKVYLGDVTAGALTKVVTDAMKADFRKLDRQFSLMLTKHNYDPVMNTGQHYRLVMLHEADDEDDVDVYDDIAETFENEPNVVIARINVDFEKKLKRHFNAVEFPSFYWLTKGTASKKKRYGGSLNIEQMISFVNKEVGLFRTKGGRLNPYAGLIEPLDNVLNNYGRALYEIKEFDKIRTDMRGAISKLPAYTDEELVNFYNELLDELEEDRSIEVLDETRNRIYRRMDDVGPLTFDQLIRKRNIVQKIIDIIGYHLLQQLSKEDFNAPFHGSERVVIDEHGLEFHEEL